MPRELTLRETQLCELDILRKATAWLTENGIRYSLWSGTLLGAIRHGGFIPWDDDIDICVPREDYERMKALIRAGKCEIPGVEPRLPGERNYFNSTAKFVDPNTVTYNSLEKRGYSSPLWIDVFPLDHLPQDDAAFSRELNRFRWLRYILWTENVSRENHPRFNGRSLRRKCLWCACRMLNLVLGGHRTLTRLLDGHSRRLDRKYADSPRLGNLTWTPYSREYYAAGDGFQVHLGSFEGEEYFIINEYDLFLTTLYGDYMTPPPENKRGLHNTSVYSLRE